MHRKQLTRVLASEQIGPAKNSTNSRSDVFQSPYYSSFYGRTSTNNDVYFRKLTDPSECDLKLAGYQVFHFGAEELQNSDSAQTVRVVFESLFKEYRVTIPS